jgi:hypothetical protein
MQLAGVRRQLEEAREALTDSAARAAAGDYDPAYRAALRSRNLLFHATRGLAAARGEELPEMPVVGVPGGAHADHEAALAAVERALAGPDDVVAMGRVLDEARPPWARYLGWLRDELGKTMRGAR